MCPCNYWYLNYHETVHFYIYLSVSRKFRVHISVCIFSKGNAVSIEHRFVMQLSLQNKCWFHISWSRIVNGFVMKTVSVGCHKCMFIWKRALRSLLQMRTVIWNTNKTSIHENYKNVTQIHWIPVYLQHSLLICQNFKPYPLYCILFINRMSEDWKNSCTAYIMTCCKRRFTYE